MVIAPTGVRPGRGYGVPLIVDRLILLVDIKFVPSVDIDPLEATRLVVDTRVV